MTAAPTLDHLLTSTLPFQCLMMMVFNHSMNVAVTVQPGSFGTVLTDFILRLLSRATRSTTNRWRRTMPVKLFSKSTELAPGAVASQCFAARICSKQVRTPMAFRSRSASLAAGSYSNASVMLTYGSTKLSASVRALGMVTPQERRLRKCAHDCGQPTGTWDVRAWMHIITM